MTAGYSGTPLAKKLGIKTGMRVVALAAPAGWAELLSPLPEGVKMARRTETDEAFVHLFAADRAALDRKLPAAKASLAPDGVLWISWPKKASGVATDLDGNAVRGAGLEAGLVDVKVCAVDDTWSGLKFVYRLRDRT